MSSSNSIRWAGPAMILGGLLWIVMYGTEIILGVTTGELPDDLNQPLVRLEVTSFFGAFFFLGIGLLGLGAWLAGRSRKLGIAGGLLALVAVVTALVNLVLLSGVLGEPKALSSLGGMGVISILGSATLLASGALRVEALPRWARLVLLIAGVVTFPVILATTPLQAVLPRHDYVIENLPFPIVGIALMAVGYAMLADRRSEPGRPAPNSA